jgi:predicted RND superfamily exporter protein
MIEEMDDAYGGINIVQMEMDSGHTNGINHPVFLNYLDEVHRAAQRHKGVTAVYSYTQLMSVINEVWEGGKQDSFRLPSSSIKTVLFSGIINSQKAQLPFLTMLCDTNFQTAQLTLRTRDMSSKAYLKLLESMEKLAKDKAPKGVEVSAQSGIRSILEADRRIVRSQQQSVLWTVGLIGLILAFLWRSAGLAVLALGINLLPIGMIIALQGLLGIPLNSITIMVAAIALGIAVDDTIHFITHWKDKISEGAGPEEAVCEAMRVKARPILATTAILVGMMMVFWVSVFPPVIHFGLLLSAGLVGALVAALVLLPVWLGRAGE